MRSRLVNITLWLSFVLAMGASIGHLAWTFGTVERPGWEWLGWVPAISVDAGLAALAYTIQQRKRAKRGTTGLWIGVAGFAIISALANFYHGIAVEVVSTPALSSLISAPVIMIAKVIILSATLPIMYIFLGEIVSGDDATAAKTLEAQAEREQKRLDRQADTERIKAETAAKEAENERTRLAQSAKESEPAPAPQFYHAACGRSFASQNALNAHLSKCNVVHSVEASEISPEHPNGKGG